MYVHNVVAFEDLGGEARRVRCIYIYVLIRQLQGHWIEKSRFRHQHELCTVSMLYLDRPIEPSY